MKSNDVNADSIDLNQSQNATVGDRTVLDLTIAIENKSQTATECYVWAIVKKRVIFKVRPKPIIANVAKNVWN